MSKTVLVTDADAVESAGYVQDHDYEDVNGVAVSGADAARSIEEGVRDTSRLADPVASQEDTGKSGLGLVAGGGMDMVNWMGSKFLEYKIIGHLTGSTKSVFGKALTGFGVFVGQKLNILPTSVTPIVGAASSLVGSVFGTQASALIEKAASLVPEPNTEDTSLLTRVMTGAMEGTGSAIEYVRDSLGMNGTGEEEGPVRGQVTEGNDFLERDGGDITVATAESRVRAIYANVFGEDAPDLATADVRKVREYMSANGRLMATDGVFASCANKAGTDREFAGMRAMTSAACSLLEEGLASGTSASKVAEGFVTMAEGFAAYESGAFDGFAEKYPDGSDKAVEGLSKVMSASRAPLASTIARLQEERQLFSESQMETLRELVPELAADVSSEYGLSDYEPDESVLTAHLDDYGTNAVSPLSFDGSPDAGGAVSAAPSADNGFAVYRDARKLPDVPSEDAGAEMPGVDYGKI